MPKSIRKTAWKSAKQPDNIVKAPVLNPNAAVETRYYARLAKLIDRMTADVEKQIKALFKTDHAEEYFAQDASISSQARIITNALTKKYTDLFGSLAKPISEQFVEESDKSSDVALKSSIRQLSDQLTLSTKSISSGPINDILTASVAENVALIKSIPQQYLSGVQQAVMRSITTGNGMQDLVPYIAKHKGITLRRARFIAKDQTKKAFENLSSARMENVGLDKFIWRHSGGSNYPRRYHQHTLNGTVCSLSKPPLDEDGKPVLPGQKPGCRCRKQPVIEFED